MNEIMTADPGMMRASNDDRELAIADLYAACQRGRLSPEEYQVRTDAVRQAPTIGDLWSLTGDIPRAILPVAARVTPVFTPNGFAAYTPPTWMHQTIPTPALRERVHPIAVVAFAISLFGIISSQMVYGSAVALVLAVLALRQVHDTEDGTGYGLATAALAISATSLLIAIELIIHAHS